MRELKRTKTIIKEEERRNTGNNRNEQLKIDYFEKKK